jgi:type IV pilus assembly protein PilA
MTDIATRRLARRRAQDGFTLTELLVVLAIVAILLAVAVSSYMGFRDRGSDAAAQALIRQIGPAIEAYYSDNGSYSGMTLARLRAYDGALNPARFTLASVTPTSYCVHSTYGGKTWRKDGPTEPPEQGACGAP